MSTSQRFNNRIEIKYIFYRKKGYNIAIKGYDFLYTQGVKRAIIKQTRKRNIMQEKGYEKGQSYHTYG